MFEYRIALFEFEYKCISLFVSLNIASSALRFARSASPWIDLPHFQKRRGRDLSMKLIDVNTHRRIVLTRIWGFPLKQLTRIDQLTSSNIGRLRADILITDPRAWQENKIGDLCRLWSLVNFVLTIGLSSWFWVFQTSQQKLCKTHSEMSLKLEMFPYSWEGAICGRCFKEQHQGISLRGGRQLQYYGN